MASGCYRTAAISPMETVKKKNTSGRFRDELSIYIYMYMCIYIYICVVCVCVCVCMYVYIYIYIL